MNGNDPQLHTSYNTELWMLWGFFDESGHHGDDGHLVQLSIGGCIASLEAWKAFSMDWSTFLEGLGLSWFHMKEFEAYQKEFAKLDKNKKEDREKHNSILNEALGIMNRHPLHYFGLTLLVPDEHRPTSGKKTLQVLYEGNVIDMIWQAGQHASALNDEIALVFARNKDFSLARIEDHFGDFQNNNPRLRSVTVDDPRRNCPLQAADIVAYEVRCYHRSEICSERRERYPMRALMNGGGFQALEWRMSPPTLSRKFFLDHPLLED